MIFGRRPRAPVNAFPEPNSVHNSSMILPLFIERLEKRTAGIVLDIGPVCGENVSFFSPLVGKLYICDMFLQLDKAFRKGVPTGQIWRHLDYPSKSFDGILLWDLPDRLEDMELGKLVDLCQDLLRSEGVIVVFSLSGQTATNSVDSFVMREGFRFHQRRRPHLSLPFHRRQNRDMLGLLAPFEPIKSYIHRNGLREFLFQKGLELNY